MFFRMRHSLRISIVLSLALTISSSIGISLAIPKVWAEDLTGDNGVYESSLSSVPVRIADATLNVSVLQQSYCKVILEVRCGEQVLRFHLSEMKITYHFTYDIFEFIGSLTSRDISLRVIIDTDGIIPKVPHVEIVYYGFW